MQNREFENKVQGKMDELKLTPSDAVWDKVEAGLPKEKKRRWVIFILLFAVLMAGLFVWNSFNKNATNSTAQEMIPKNETHRDSIASGTIIENKKSADTITISPTTSNKLRSTRFNKNKKEIFSARTKVKIKRPSEGSLADSKDENIVNTNLNELITKADTKIKIKTPEVSANEEAIVTADNITIIISADSVPVTVKQDNLKVTTATAAVDSLVAVKKDTLITATKENKKIKNSDHWHYGIELAGGSSNVKSSLFSNGPVYADLLSSAVSFPGGGNPGSGSNIIPNKPTRSVGLNAGFYAEKNISRNWIFKIGLNYLYQSNTIKVGTKIDSVINFSLDMNKNLTATSYYHTGNSVNYKNKFQLLEIPLIFQYQFPKSSRFYAEAGPAITYLLHSNALVYSTRSQAYVTDKDIFNKLGISINGGAAINLARRSALPFSIGYRFKYNMGSIVKSSFGKQHFINSFFYLKIPLKK